MSSMDAAYEIFKKRELPLDERIKRITNIIDEREGEQSVPMKWLYVLKLLKNDLPGALWVERNIIADMERQLQSLDPEVDFGQEGEAQEYREAIERGKLLLERLDRESDKLRKAKELCAEDLRKLASAGMNPEILEEYAKELEGGGKQFPTHSAY